MYAETSVMADKQYEKLNEQDKTLYTILKNSKPIHDLINCGCNGNYNPMINFKITRESNRIYFSFDIAEAVGIEFHPDLLYNVKGSILDSDNGRNIVYTISDVKDKSLRSTYVDNMTRIKGNVILNELSYIEPKKHKSRAIFVCLTINEFPLRQDEKFIIETDSELYQLYLKRQIDVSTLCNLALFQANNSGGATVIEDEPTSFTKQLSKPFI